MGQSVYFNVSGNGFKGGRVAAVKSQGLTGFGHAGDLWTPDMTQVRALLPQRWRAAFDRDGQLWWGDQAATGVAYAVRHLNGSKGKPLTSIYLNPNVEG